MSAGNRPGIDEQLRMAGLPPLPRTAWLEIDLAALGRNLAVVRALAGPGVRVEPVVKADAYGHGAVPVSLALEAAGADGFGVAALDEAVELRTGGIAAPIHVLYPIPPARTATAIAGSIDVTAGDPLLLRALLREVADGGPPLGIQLEVETGLGRGGFAGGALVDAARAIVEAPGARLVGLWSHLQAAEDEPLTAEQVRRFDAAVDSVRAAGIDVPARHLAASGGLLVRGIPAYESVRPGLAVYGLVPDELDETALPPAAADLEPILSLHARPVRVAELPAGHGISYGPTFSTSRRSRIATLPLGYGDGWPRSLSNRAEALVRGVRVPMVGNVAMDATMVDVTDVPGRPVDVTDEFVLIGEQGGARITVREVARLRTTNSWETVTAMSRRLARVYHASAGPIGIRTLISGEDRWLGSSSGTAISAISKSTPS